MPETSQPQGDSGNGRATIREVYDLIQDQNRAMHEMELRLMGEIKKLAPCTDIDRLDGELEDIKKITYSWSGVNTALSLLAGVLAGVFGINK